MQRVIVVALCVATLSIFLDHVNLMPTIAVEKAGEEKVSLFPDRRFISEYRMTSDLVRLEK